jgi:hypothetical protein
LRAARLLSIPTSFIRSTIDFLQSSFSGFFAAKSSRMAVTSTACAGAAGGEEDVAEAVGVAGLLGVAVPTVLVGEATAGEVGAAPGDEEVAEAAGVVGLVGAAAATVVVGEATTGEAGVAPPEGAAVACPNIFDMRLVNIPITPKNTPRRDRKPAQPFYFLQFTEGIDVQRGGPWFLP